MEVEDRLLLDRVDRNRRDQAVGERVEGARPVLTDAADAPTTLGDLAVVRAEQTVDTIAVGLPEQRFVHVGLLAGGQVHPVPPRARRLEQGRVSGLEQRMHVAHDR